MFRWIVSLLIVGVFVLLVALFVARIGDDPNTLPSTLIGDTAPAFTAPVLGKHGENFSPENMRGEVWVLNVWASWCVSCRAEHAQLITLQDRGVTLIGLNYKDSDEAARTWLRDWGDPYQLSVVDANGRIGIDFGVYGVPESFVMDAAGRVRHKHTGPIMAADVTPLLDVIKSLE